MIEGIKVGLSKPYFVISLTFTINSIMVEQIGQRRKLRIDTFKRLGVFKWTGCFLSVFFLNILVGQSTQFKVETNYIGCDSVGSIRIMAKDPLRKYQYSMVSNDCGFLVKTNPGFWNIYAFGTLSIYYKGHR